MGFKSPKIKTIKITSKPTFKAMHFGFGLAIDKSGKWGYQRIIGTCNWYFDKVDSTHEVIDFDNDFYRVNNPFGCGFFFIHKNDCKILKNN